MVKLRRFGFRSQAPVIPNTYFSNIKTTTYLLGNMDLLCVFVFVFAFVFGVVDGIRLDFSYLGGSSAQHLLPIFRADARFFLFLFFLLL